MAVPIQVAVQIHRTDVTSVAESVSIHVGLIIVRDQGAVVGRATEEL